jgi:hypothetical protein
MVAGLGSVRQLHHASLPCVHSAERPSRMRKIIVSSEMLPSGVPAVRARYFCNGKTLVYKRTIVLKKISCFLDISQEDSTFLKKTRHFSRRLDISRLYAVMLDGARPGSFSSRWPVCITDSAEREQKAQKASAVDGSIAEFRQAAQLGRDQKSVSGRFSDGWSGWKKHQA